MSALNRRDCSLPSNYLLVLFLCVLMLLCSGILIAGLGTRHLTQDIWVMMLKCGYQKLKSLLN